MNIEITEISVMRAAKVGALIGFFYSLFVLALMSLGLVSSTSWLEKLAVGMLALVMAPLLGICYGAVLGSVGALCYNFVASRWGGLVIATRELPGATARREVSQEAQELA